MTIYDDRNINDMYEGKKKETRRKYNPNRRPGIPGTIHWIKKDRTKKVYGQYKVIDCYPQKFGDIKDYEAWDEGWFENKKEFKKYWRNINGEIGENDLVWVMKIQVLWVNLKGIILTKERKEEITNDFKKILKLEKDFKDNFNIHTSHTSNKQPWSLGYQKDAPHYPIGRIKLYNVKDETIYNYINNHTPYSVQSIFHNGFNSEVSIRLNEEHAKQYK